MVRTARIQFFSRMTSTLDCSVQGSTLDGADMLFQLQLRVARRADAILREPGAALLAPEWLAWLRAEREVLGAEL